MIAVGARARELPLEPCAALALGGAVPPLVTRLLELDEERLSRMRAVRGRLFLLIQGGANDLPWSEGLLYLGKDEAAPRVLLPTTTAPSVPSALFERALARRCADAALAGPWAVCLEPRLVISVASAQPLSRQRVRTLLDLPPTAEPS